MQNWASYLPLVLIVLAFWLLVLRPARNRQKEFMATQTALEPGARVMLASGIFGELVAVREDEVDIRVASDVVLTAARQAVAKIIVPQEAPPIEESADESDDPTDPPRTTD
jgi:preprotein translocase subunit YajC